jgi:hypothetical protein
MIVKLGVVPLMVQTTRQVRGGAIGSVGSPGDNHEVEMIRINRSRSCVCANEVNTGAV